MSQNSTSSRIASVVLGSLLFLIIGMFIGAFFLTDATDALLDPFAGSDQTEAVPAEIQVLNEAPTVEAIIEDAVPVATESVEIEDVQPSGDVKTDSTGTPILSPLSSARQDGELQDTLIDIYKRTNPSVVHIFALVQNAALGSGTGFIIDNEGHILTNNHVIQSAETLEIKFPNGFRTNAVVVGTDQDADVAIIKVDELPEDAQPLPLGNSSDLSVGEFVVAIGNPFGQDSSMSLGIVSALGRGLPSDRLLPGGGSYQLPDAIQIDAPINPGNSGGPLLNLNGEVVGINARIFSETGANSGVGFSIPIDIVERMIPSLIEDGSYIYPFVGVSVQSDFGLAAAEQFGLDRTTGAYVTSVVPGGPAEQAGFRSFSAEDPTSGDLIIAINGEDVKTFEDMISYLYLNTSPGDSITVTVLRDGEPLDLSLTLAERP